MGARACGGREALALGALCGAWYAASAASNVVGKLVLTELPRPATVALAQLAATAALTAPALRLLRVPPAPAAGLARRLLPLAVAKFLTTLCSQFSIWKVPVSYAHTVKATTPLWTAGLGWALLGERPPPRVAGALLLLAAGVALASLTELSFDARGLLAALAAAALLALQHLYSKRFMRAARLHPLRLLQTLSALALALLAPAWWWADGAGALAELAAAPGRTRALLAADGALAWLQAVLALSVLARVSPLAYAVASAAKRALVVLASLLLLRNPAPPLNVAGMALALLGVLAYNRVRARPAAAPLLPV